MKHTVKLPIGPIPEETKTLRNNKEQLKEMLIGNTQYHSNAFLPLDLKNFSQ